jgi:hypothetical protein
VTSVPNPGNTLPTETRFTAAGADLTVTVAGVLWDPLDDTESGVGDGLIDAGRDYFDNIPAPGYAHDTRLVPSSSGFTPTTGSPGTLNNFFIPLADFSAGSETITDLQYTDVGSFTLQSEALGYLGVSGLDIPGDSIIVGRFNPASFQVAIDTPGTFAEACIAFTYIGQNFTYATSPVVTVTALNALGNPTLNYRDDGAVNDDFVFLNSGSLTADATQDDSTPGSDGAPLLVSYTVATMVDNANNDGSGSVTYTFGSDTFRYGPDTLLAGFSKFANSRVDEFPADINPLITLVDDGEVSTVVAQALSPLTPPQMRFGRLRMTNTHGSEVNDLNMPVIAEYWDNGSFQLNSLDICTAIDQTTDLNVDASNLTGSTTVTVDQNPAILGNVGLSLSPPGAGNEGYVDIITELDTATSLWLRDDWDNDGDFDDDPRARATFGIFEGDDVQIYIEQIYQ